MTHDENENTGVPTGQVCAALRAVANEIGKADRNSAIDLAKRMRNSRFRADPPWLVEARAAAPHWAEVGLGDPRTSPSIRVSTARHCTIGRSDSWLLDGFSVGWPAFFAEVKRYWLATGVPAAVFEPAPLCASCQSPIGSHGPPVEGWEPTICGDCCDCGAHNDTEGRCVHCGSWDMDRHGDTPPPLTSEPFDRAVQGKIIDAEFAHSGLYCPMCEDDTLHEAVPAVSGYPFDPETGADLDPAHWRCMICTATNYTEHPETGLRLQVEREPFWPRGGGNEIGVPLLQPWGHGAPVLEPERVRCDGDHAMPWCGDECWHGPRPRPGDVVSFCADRDAEYGRAGEGVVDSVGAKTVEVGICGCKPLYIVAGHRLAQRHFPDIEHARIQIVARREER